LLLSADNPLSDCGREVAGVLGGDGEWYSSEHESSDELGLFAV